MSRLGFRQMRRGTAALLAALMLGSAPVRAAEAADPNWLPLQAAGAALLPGMGYVLLGQPEAAARTLGAMAVPTTLAVLRVPPILPPDLRGYYAPDPRMGLFDLENRQSAFATTAVKLWWLQMYTSYQEARRLTDNRGFPQPLKVRTAEELVAAPFLAESWSDWRVWAVVGLGLVETWLMRALFEPETLRVPSVLAARATSLGSQPISPMVGYAVDTLGTSLLSLQPGVGEEVLFRGLVQDELERHMGPWGSLGVTSVFVGLLHYRNAGWRTDVRQVGTPLIAELLLGYLYQASGYDMTKPIAAHVYYDVLDFAVANWHPRGDGLSGLGVRYTF